jgi:hypothetical protein
MILTKKLITANARKTINNIFPTSMESPAIPLAPSKKATNAKMQ